MSPEIGIAGGYKVPINTLPLALLQLCIFGSMGLIRASERWLLWVDVYWGQAWLVGQRKNIKGRLKNSS